MFPQHVFPFQLHLQVSSSSHFFPTWSEPHPSFVQKQVQDRLLPMGIIKGPTLSRCWLTLEFQWLMWLFFNNDFYYTPFSHNKAD